MSAGLQALDELANDVNAAYEEAIVIAERSSNRRTSSRAESIRHLEVSEPADAVATMDVLESWQGLIKRGLSFINSHRTLLLVHHPLLSPWSSEWSTGM